MSLTEEKVAAINKIAQQINCASDEYQLIHATFALEKIFNEQQKNEFQDDIAELRKEAQANDGIGLETLRQRYEELRDSDKFKKVRISVRYADISENSARTTKTKNSYAILLPENLKKIRDSEGKIDYDKLKNLRKLMAHELGHIALHSSDIGGSAGTGDFAGNREEEADWFAEQLIELRRKRNAEIYKDAHYKEI